jgi:hypothetical protein
MRAAPLLLLVASSCNLTFDEDRIYSCANDFDCAGGGYQCVSGLCCRATGPERCGDGIDNDCDGRVDDVACKVTAPSCDAGMIIEAPREFACEDGADDDGDGLTDCADSDCEDLSCGLGCVCVNGQVTETDCGDGIDNDSDGLGDCADEVDCPAGSSCTKRSNGQAGLCQAVNKACN